MQRKFFINPNTYKTLINKNYKYSLIKGAFRDYLNLFVLRVLNLLTWGTFVATLLIRHNKINQNNYKQSRIIKLIIFFPQEIEYAIS